MARVASQRLFVHEKRHVCVCFDHIVIFSHFFELKQKKHTLTFCEDLSTFQPVNSDLRPFRALLDDVGAKTTPA